MPFTVENLGQVALPMADQARAEAFYRGRLGLPFLFNVPGKLSFFGLGATRLMLALPEGDGKPAGASILYLKLRGLEAAVAELEAGGVEILHKPSLVAPMPDHDLWMAFFKDSEGNTLGLMEEKAKA